MIEDVLREAQPGDLIMTIGAGSITKMAEVLAESLRNAAPISVARAGTVPGGVLA